ncbi:Uncharacterised protein [Mycobacteroides abscessus subsp. bolletii]|nr:Uncharacterised protein [Mycobacteroides abscessus subsp. bolletii]
MFTTFDLEFAWIGLGAAVVLTVVLLSTDVLRSDLTVSRWRDPSCLGWLAVAMYLFHIFEEYGIAASGTRHAFPDTLCTTLGIGTYPNCPIPTEFYLFVNIGLTWLVAVLCALLARRYVMLGFAFYSLVSVNCFFHIGAALLSGTYNPGLLTSIAMFLPASAWVGYVFLKHREPALGVGRLLGIIAVGMVVNGALPLSINLYLHGVISRPFLDLLQLAIAGLIPIVGALLEPRPERISSTPELQR